MFRLPLPGASHLEINLDEMVRRCRQEWRGPAVAFVIFVLCDVASPFALAAARGAGTVVVTGAESVMVDGVPMPAGSLRIPVGVHRLRAERTGWIARETSLTVTRNLTVTWTVAFTIRKPYVREIRPGTPGYRIDDLGWYAPARIRFHASEALRAATPQTGRQQATAIPLGLPKQIWELDASNGRTARRMDLEGAGLAGSNTTSHQGTGAFAQQGITADGDHETLIRTLPGSDGEPATLLFERTGQANIARVPLPESVWVEQVHWSPQHQQAIIVARTGSQPAEAAAVPAALRVLRYAPERGVETITDLPGDLVQFGWSDQPDAAFAMTIGLHGQSTLALVLVRPDGTAQYLQDLPRGLWAHDQAPLSWTPDALLYAAPAANGEGVAVWRASLNGAEPTELLRADARAFMLDMSVLRYLRVEQGLVELCSVDLQTGQETETFVIADVPATPDLVGWWRGGQILIRNDERAFLVTLDPISRISVAASTGDATATPAYSEPERSASRLARRFNDGRATTGAAVLQLTPTAEVEPMLDVKPVGIVTPTPQPTAFSSEPQPLPTLQGE